MASQGVRMLGFSEHCSFFLFDTALNKRLYTLTTESASPSPTLVSIRLTRPC